MSPLISTIITIALAIAVILCLIFEPALIKWEDKQKEKIWRKYKESRKYKK